MDVSQDVRAMSRQKSAMAWAVIACEKAGDLGSENSSTNRDVLESLWVCFRFATRPTYGCNMGMVA